MGKIEQKRGRFASVSAALATVADLIGISKPERTAAPQFVPKVKTKAHPIFQPGWRPEPENDRQRRLRDEIDTEAKRQRERAFARATNTSGDVRGRFVPASARARSHKPVGRTVRSLSQVHFKIIAADRDRRRRELKSAHGQRRRVHEVGR